MFNFHGTCRYQLTSDCISEKFTIRMRTERRFSNVYAWSKALTIHLGDTTIVLHKDLQVKVNKSDAELPYYHLPQFQITKGSFTITVVSDIGVQVQWDGNGFIEIHVPKSFEGKVCGLCGNFNGNSKDDFMLKSGKLASSAREFGEHWSLGRRNHGCEKAPSPPVDSTVSNCFNRLRVYWRAHKRCWPIKKQFANCHKKVKPNAFFWSCIADVCQCSGRRCECEAVMAYARACRREGVAVSWGRKNTCGKSLSVIQWYLSNSGTPNSYRLRILECSWDTKLQPCRCQYDSAEYCGILWYLQGSSMYLHPRGNERHSYSRVIGNSYLNNL